MIFKNETTLDELGQSPPYGDHREIRKEMHFKGEGNGNGNGKGNGKGNDTLICSFILISLLF